MRQSYETHSDFIGWNFSQRLTSRRATALRSAAVFSPGDRRRRRLFYFQIALYLPICFTIARLRMFLPCRGNVYAVTAGRTSARRINGDTLLRSRIDATVNLIAPRVTRHLSPQNKLPGEILIDPRDIARARQ